MPGALNEPKRDMAEPRKKRAATKAAAPEVDSGVFSRDPHVETLQMLRIVIRAAQRHSAWIEKQCGVTGAQMWVLQELHENPGLRVGEVAGRLAIQQATASNLIESLARKQCIDKLRDPEDQRVVRLFLSRHGGDVVKRAPSPARGLLPEALRKMDAAALRHLAIGLHALLGVIEFCDEKFALQPLPFTM